MVARKPVFHSNSMVGPGLEGGPDSLFVGPLWAEG